MDTYFNNTRMMKIRMYYIFEYIFYRIKDEEKQKFAQFVVLVAYLYANKHGLINTIFLLQHTIFL